MPLQPPKGQEERTRSPAFESLTPAPLRGVRKQAKRAFRVIFLASCIIIFKGQNMKQLILKIINQKYLSILSQFLYILTTIGQSKHFYFIIQDKPNDLKCTIFTINVNLKHLDILLKCLTRGKNVKTKSLYVVSLFTPN